MRFWKFLLIVAGLLQFGLAAGFFLQQPWALSLWPFPDTQFSYISIAAVLAGSGAPLIWIAVSDELGALAGYGLSFAVMFAGMGVAAGRYYGQAPAAALGGFTLAMAALALIAFFLFVSMRNYAWGGLRTPGLVRGAFVLETLVLGAAGALLILRIPTTLPWSVNAKSSGLYGWVFIGLAYYFLYATLRPNWINALGPLLAFLVYDMVLFGPILSLYGGLPSGHLDGGVAALVIMVLSTLLGLFYLFVNPRTRLLSRTR